MDGRLCRAAGFPAGPGLAALSPRVASRIPPALRCIAPEAAVRDMVNPRRPALLAAVLRAAGSARSLVLLIPLVGVLLIPHARAEVAVGPATPLDLSAVSPAPPANISASDTPNDGGGAITLRWDLSPDDGAGLGTVTGYVISRVDTSGGEPMLLAALGPGVDTYVDSPVEDGTPYNYFVTAMAGDVASRGAGGTSALAGPQWFNFGRTSVLVSIVGFAALLIWFISRARRGTELFIRKIAGLEAVDEAVGRATELGKPILYVSGLNPMDDVATLAAINILGRVARRAAEYGSKLVVPCYDPMVMAVEQEVVKEAFLEVGRPDAYREEMVFYVTNSQFGYTAAVDGIMVRDRPATNFFMGYFYAESLILAETGASTGAIQIAGTDAVAQLPFFITACDYTLIGEELYAASAYLSREPLLLGSLKGQDWAKLILVVLAITGAVLSVARFDWFRGLFAAR